MISLTLLCYLMVLPLQGDTPNPWNFRFGFGVIFPDASEIVGANSPNGMNISAGMGYQYFSHLQLLGTLHFDYLKGAIMIPTATAGNMNLNLPIP